MPTKTRGAAGITAPKPIRFLDDDDDEDDDEQSVDEYISPSKHKPDMQEQQQSTPLSYAEVAISPPRTGMKRSIRGSPRKEINETITQQTIKPAAKAKNKAKVKPKQIVKVNNQTVQLGLTFDSAIDKKKKNDDIEEGTTTKAKPLNVNACWLIRRILKAPESTRSGLTAVPDFCWMIVKAVRSIPDGMYFHDDYGSLLQSKIFNVLNDGTKRDIPLAYVLI